VTQGIQIAVPISDDFLGNWTKTPLFQNVTQAPPIVSGVSPRGDACQMMLTKLAWPAPGTETLTVTAAGDNTTRLAVALLQDGVGVIAAATFTPLVSFTTYTLTLTDAQVAQITDYTQLHVELIAGDVTVPCCAVPMPAILTCTFSNANPPFCYCLNGVSATLAWNGAGWVGAFAACDASTTVELSCLQLSQQWAFATLGGTGCTFNGGDLSVSGCGVGQTLITFAQMVLGGCCFGNVDVTITG
jgi:hypothetical protein